MANKVSDEVLQDRLEERIGPSSEPSFFRRVLPAVIFLLLFTGVCAWGYHLLFQKYRLPQNRILHGAKGQNINARIEGRADSILKYTLLDDNTVRYITVTQLSPADQEFAAQLPNELKLTLPLDYLLPGEGGKEQRVRLDARSEDWIKYSKQTDGSVHYAPIFSLPAAEQEFMHLLPTGLYFQYPLDYSFSGNDARGRVQWLGRSEAMAKYMTANDNVVHYDLISTLPPQEQGFVKLLPNQIAYDYPMAHPLHSKDGATLATRLNGRAEQVVKGGVDADRVDRYFLIDDLAEPDQRFVRALPAALNLYFPLDAVVTMADGSTQTFRLDGRTLNLVRATTVEDNASNLYPLSAFSVTDQKIIQMMPARLTLRFPFDYTLVDEAGRRFQARIVGRSEFGVQFTLADGKTYGIPLSKLSPMSHAVLQSFPANLGQVDAGAPTASSAALPSNTRSSAPNNQAGALRTVRSQLTALMAAMAPTSARLTAPGVTGNERAAIETQLNPQRRSLENLYKQLVEIRGASPGPSDTPEVAKMRTRIDVLIRDNNNLDLRLKDSKALPAQQRTAQTNMDRNLQEEETLIKRIINIVGMDNL